MVVAGTRDVVGRLEVDAVGEMGDSVAGGASPMTSNSSSIRFTSSVSVGPPDTPDGCNPVIYR